MATDTTRIADPFSFQVGRDDLGPLVEELALVCDAYSPLVGPLGPYAKGSGVLSEEGARIAAEPLAAKALRILAQPTLRMVNQTGGGAFAASYFTACLCRDVDASAIAVLNPSFEGACLIQLFPDPAQYLVWWLIVNATSADAYIANYMPPPVRLESLVYMLHAIDAFRRGAYRSLLDYAPTEQPAVAPAEFAESMQASIRSRDLRWLLPAVLNLTPNLNVASFDDDPALAQALERHGFLTPSRDAGTHEPLLVFGEAGKIMGVEFYRTWLQSAGFETTVKTAGGWRVAHRGFLAPTGLANHLFLFETDGDGACLVNHQAMPRDALDTRMMALLTAAVEMKDGAAAAEPAPPPQAPAVGLRCPSCNAEVPAGGQFCQQCGGRLAKEKPPSRAAPGTCAKCGTALDAGAKFCTRCGTKA